MNSKIFALIVVFTTFLFTSLAWSKWEPGLNPLPSGWKRTLIHMHSVYSKDACDRKPWKKGKMNTSCLNDFRKALCETRIDLVFMTEHKKKMAEVAIEDTLVIQETDEPILETVDGEQKIVGSVQTCSNGHRVQLFLGAENNLMPIGMTKHPEPVDGDLMKSYAGDDAAAVKRFQDTGALVAVPHVEDKSIEYLRSIQPDLLELYNPHGNLKLFMKDKNPIHWIQTLGSFIKFLTVPGSAVDLTFLSYYKQEPKILTRWAQYSLESPIHVIAGSDTHQNSFFIKAKDGERLDGYRRAMRHFSNYLLLPDGPVTRPEALAALKKGQSFIVFEVFGSPEVYEFSAQVGGTKHPMGSQVSLSEGPVNLESAFLESDWMDHQKKKAKFSNRILKATPSGWVIVEETQGRTLSITVNETGVYRSEIQIDPNHLSKYAPTQSKLLSDRPWIQSNAIWVVD